MQKLKVKVVKKEELIAENAVLREKLNAVIEKDYEVRKKLAEIIGGRSFNDSGVFIRANNSALDWMQISAEVGKLIVKAELLRKYTDPAERIASLPVNLTGF